MSITTTDRRGNAHRSAGVPGAGRFTLRENTAPADLLEADSFDEEAWRASMEARIDAGEPDDAGQESAETVNILDPTSWPAPPF